MEGLRGQPIKEARGGRPRSLERFVEVLEAGGLEIAGEKVRQQMLDRLSLAEEGVD